MSDYGSRMRKKHTEKGSKDEGRVDGNVKGTDCIEWRGATEERRERGDKIK